MVIPSTSKIALHYLRYVLAAAEKGSFRQAANELGVWESTISRGIHDLEDEIGVALFIRHPGGVTLTNAGNKFLTHARAAIGRIEYALKDAGAAGRGEVGMVRIGIFSSLASGFLADLLQAYQAGNPFVHLDFAEGGPAEHVAAVQHHRMDVAFLTGEPAAYGCETARLWEERVFVVLPRDHGLAEREEIGWDDLRDEHFIVSETNPGPEIHDYLVLRGEPAARSALARGGSWAEGTPQRAEGGALSPYSSRNWPSLTLGRRTFTLQ
ncbi:MAG: LysR family transcriptional regulator [Methylovirgula sp.]|uniref:LysR family transcriptional regulator n=1 Tax=Methylovirgula sp. TaxID=1978224 RepID=UPI0030767A51